MTVPELPVTFPVTFPVTLPVILPAKALAVTVPENVALDKLPVSRLVDLVEISILFVPLGGASENVKVVPDIE